MNEDDPNAQHPSHHWPGQHWPPAQQLPPWWAFMPSAPVAVAPGYDYQRGYQAGLQRALVTGVPETPGQGAGMTGAQDVGTQIAVAVVSGVLVAIAVSLVFGGRR